MTISTYSEFLSLVCAPTLAADNQLDAKERIVLNFVVVNISDYIAPATSLPGSFHPVDVTPSSPITPVVTIAPITTVKTEVEPEKLLTVKNLLTNFVEDLNRHLADNFGTEALGFELSEKEREKVVPEVLVVKEEIIDDVKVASAPAAVVHHSVFCDSCL